MAATRATERFDNSERTVQFLPAIAARRDFGPLVVPLVLVRRPFHELQGRTDLRGGHDVQERRLPELDFERVLQCAVKDRFARGVGKIREQQRLARRRRRRRGAIPGVRCVPADGNQHQQDGRRDDMADAAGRERRTPSRRDVRECGRRNGCSPRARTSDRPHRPNYLGWRRLPRK